MSKIRWQYVCQSCGYASPKWLGRCPSCEAWNAFVEEAVGDGPSGRRPAPAAVPVPVTEVPPTGPSRVSTGIGELDRVLGGGLVPGSVVLIGGDPGIGKSTLLLRACQQLAAQGRTVLYASAEESLAQVRLRADRLGVAEPRLLLLSDTDLDAILAACDRVRPEVLVVDSIQTVGRPDMPSSPGSVGQVRECTAELVRLAKSRGVAVLIVGHVTKEGQLAGPRMLEHMVDTVLYCEGDRHHAYRIVRATKNRFGSTNEIGVFEMTGAGLREVPNPSAAFLSGRAPDAPGSVVVAALEGTRPLLVEVQALVTPTVFGTPRRTASGVDYNRLVVLLAVLEKRAGLHLSGHDVYASAAGGVTVDDPAADLGIAGAVASSLRNRPADPTAVAIGEVGLAGEVRAVPQLEARVQEAARLGFRRCLVPRGAGLAAREIEVVEVDSLPEALATMMG